MISLEFSHFQTATPENALTRVMHVQGEVSCFIKFMMEYLAKNPEDEINDVIVMQHDRIRWKTTQTMLNTGEPLL